MIGCDFHDRSMPGFPPRLKLNKESIPFALCRLLDRVGIKSCESIACDRRLGELGCRRGKRLRIGQSNDESQFRIRN